MLFAHGARDARWAEPFEAVASRVRYAAPALAVELGYLELMKPDLIEAGARLAAAGCVQVDIVPLFLGTGGHLRRDLPAGAAALRAAHPQVRWCVGSAIGEVEAVIEAMAAAALAMASTETSGDATDAGR